MPGKDGTGPDGNGPKKNNQGVPTPRRRKRTTKPGKPARQGNDRKGGGR